MINVFLQAWETWKENSSLDIMDPTFIEVSREQVLRCIQIALLCVQDDPADRPSMSDIVLMLSNESIQLHEPNEPAYLSTKKKTSAKQHQLDELETHTLISITTVPEAR